MSALPPVVCVVGKKKSGKTVTVVGLVRALAARGYRVMTAKHGHHFRLDSPGTDSWRHRHEAGARRTVLSGPDEFAVTGGWGEGGEAPLGELVAHHLADADVVVAEGFKRSGARRIEVFRQVAHAEPLFGTDPRADALYLAILTDVSEFDADVPVLDADDPQRFERLADLVEELLMEDPP